MRRLLTATAAVAVLIGGPVMAQADPKITETCMRAQDFAGCVQTLSGGLPPKQQKDAEEGLRTWTREDGTIIRMRKASVVALKNKDGYGRYLEYTYGLEGKTQNNQWIVQADCVDYTANWDQDTVGWFSVKEPNSYLRPGAMSRKYNSTKEAKAVLDEFCPIIDTLPKSDRPIM